MGLLLSCSLETSSGVRVQAGQDARKSGSGAKLQTGRQAAELGSSQGQETESVVHSQARVWSGSKQVVCTVAQTAPCDDFLVYILALGQSVSFGGLPLSPH